MIKNDSQPQWQQPKWEWLIPVIIFLFLLLLVLMIIPVATQHDESLYQAAGECVEGDCDNGQGTYFVDVTNDYTGEFKNGKFNGLGVWSTIKDNGLFRASGTFKDNKPIDITWWKLLQIGLLDENHSWFYSGDSIEMKGDYLYVVDLDSYSSQSMTNQIQIDCKASKIRPIETAFYMDVMALGEPFQIVPNDQIPMPPEWLDIDSTPKTHLFRSLCEVYSEEIDETISSST